MAVKKTATLNPRQLLFIKYYLQTANATQSLIKAGYKTKHPHKYASNLLLKPYIANEIDKTRQIVQKKTIASFEDKAKYLWSIVKDPNIASKNKMKAIEILNHMQGHNAVTKHINVNVDIGNELETARGKYLAIEQRPNVSEVQAIEAPIDIDQNDIDIS